jgi:hypothetical protein
MFIHYVHSISYGSLKEVDMGCGTCRPKKAKKKASKRKK